MLHHTLCPQKQNRFGLVCGAESMAVRLPEELCAAVRDDRLYEVITILSRHTSTFAAASGSNAPFVRYHQARDAAKKRAVAQHVDYEAFKNMVRRALLQHDSVLSCSFK